MFLRTLQIDPTYRSTLYNLGVLYNRQRRYTEAVELLSKLATLYPDHLNGVQLLGDCYLRLQHQKKAEEMYRLVLRQNPNHTTALHNLGQLQSMTIEVRVLVVITLELFFLPLISRHLKGLLTQLKDKDNGHSTSLIPRPSPSFPTVVQAM